MKRILSFALALAMVLSLTTVVFATEAKDWETEIDTIGVAVVNGTYYNTVQAAVDAANGAVVTLLEDSQEAVVASGDLYLELNGYSLKSLKVGGKLYGMDAATDNYEESDAVIETFEGAYEPIVKNAANKRYMAIKEGSALSFHRFRFRITHVNLAPEAIGFGYRAMFDADAKLQAEVATIGYSLWVTDDIVVTRSQEGFYNTMLLRLNNYRVEEYGTTPVHAKVVVTMKDGTVYESGKVSYSMQTMLEMVEDVFDDLTLVQKRGVSNMCKLFEVVKTWDITKILTWVEE